MPPGKEGITTRTLSPKPEVRQKRERSEEAKSSLTATSKENKSTMLTSLNPGHIFYPFRVYKRAPHTTLSPHLRFSVSPSSLAYY